MIIYFFDLVIVAIACLTLYDYRKGFFAIFSSKLLLPSSIRLVIGSLNVDAQNIFHFVLIVSFILHLGFKHISLPKSIKTAFGMYAFVALLLILLSSAVVPYAYQLDMYLKRLLLIDVIYVFIGMCAFQQISSAKYQKMIIYISIVIGIYGIFTYVIKQNPYVTTMSLLYFNEEDEFSYFMDEVRGGIEGRVAGTLGHPLSWGQYWSLVLPAFLLVKKRFSKIVVFTFVPLAFANIFLCGSRTALIALVIFFIIYLGNLHLKYKIYTIVISLFASVTLLTANFKNQNLVATQKYIETIVFFWHDSKDVQIVGSSKDMRSEQFEETLRILSYNPIAGIGYNYLDYSQKKSISTKLLGLESVFMRELVEQGIVGLLNFLLLYCSLAKYYLKRYRKEKVWIIAYFASYFIAISITGIQGISWPVFVLLPMLFCIERDSHIEGDFRVINMYKENKSKGIWKK